MQVKIKGVIVDLGDDVDVQDLIDIVNLGRSNPKLSTAKKTKADNLVNQLAALPPIQN